VLESYEGTGSVQNGKVASMWWNESLEGVGSVMSMQLEFRRYKYGESRNVAKCQKV
jgi:hypothetical protein